MAILRRKSGRKGDKRRRKAFYVRNSIKNARKGLHSLGKRKRRSRIEKMREMRREKLERCEIRKRGKRGGERRRRGTKKT